jgi:hypothetical protein
VHYRDVLNSCKEIQNPTCILDLPKDNTQLKICINHLVPDLSVCNMSIMDILQIDDECVMLAVRQLGREELVLWVRIRVPELVEVVTLTYCKFLRKFLQMTSNFRRNVHYFSM